MLEITARVSALAPEAANALKVIAYFDQLVQGGAGINAIVRGAAVLSGRNAEFIDRINDIRLSFAPDGATAATEVFPTPSTHVASRDGSLRIGLAAGDGDAAELDALILERALLAASTTLGRPLDARPRDREAWIRVLIDENADADSRTNALRSLGLSESSALRIVATDEGPLLAENPDDALRQVGTARAGIGPVMPAGRASESWKHARVALLLTAEGTPEDPGERFVNADDAGSLIEIVEALVTTKTVPADVVAIERAHEHVGWTYETIYAISRAGSLRAAASLVHVHHSTLQERLTRLEPLLGWSLTSVQGRTRALLALSIRRAVRSTLG
ncbi:helix-turn-helix domain-containing protein [Streptosporangium sandarakinum]|uniref:helix-turn-helix domain-containing protein n=1 Tax=Streptosporangium sandarakinum TaxID=1260955 RepID=UPI003413E83E